MRNHGSSRLSNGEAKDALLTLLPPDPSGEAAITAMPEIHPPAENPENPRAEDAEPDEPPPTDAAGALSFAQKTIFTNISKIILGLIASAEKGNHLPARFLMELAGITPPQPSDPSDQHEESLTQLLLNELHQAKAA